LLLQVSREFSVGSSSPEHHSMMSNSGGGGGGKRVHPMVFDDTCSGIFYTPISQQNNEAFAAPFMQRQ
jgi:hypothetical protein